MPKDQKTKNPFRRLLPVIVIVAVIAIGWFAGDYINDVVVGMLYQPEAEIAEVIEHIKLTDTGNRILRASHPALQDASNFNLNCPTVSAETSTLGCYYSRRIYVYDIDNAELNGIKEAVLAHELLHAIWDRLSHSEQKRLEPYLRQVYQENEDELSEHMDSYESEDFVDELHSIIGTQLDSSKIGSELRAHYAKYFEDIDVVVEYFTSYDENLTGQRKKANQMYEEIISARTDLEKRQQLYEENNRQLNNDIDSYNARVAPGCRTDLECREFENEYNSLQQRVTLQQQEYDALTKLADELNQKIATDNNLVEHLGELMKSIDSTYIELPSAEKITN
jgi:hypothetical protein